MGWVLVRTILSLLAVLALMAGMIVVLKKHVSRGQRQASPVVSVEVLGYHALAPKRSVHVLKVLNKIIVVGVTEAGMTLLGELDDDESLQKVEELSALKPRERTPFSALVEKCMGSFVPSGTKTRQKQAARVFFG